MSDLTELRQDPLTCNWVIIAPKRDKRPHAVPKAPPPTENGPCPFCPGHEDETPPEIWRLNDAGGNWRVRVVPNKFAMLASQGDSQPQAANGFTALPGTGRHEVVVESPEHSSDLARTGIDSVRSVLEAYRVRYQALRESGAALVVIFRNHGPGAGTSLAHPHSQIVAAPMVPVDVRRRLDVAARYADRTGRNLYLDVLQRELNDGRRIVLTSDRFVAFQPFASTSPFETWIMPRLQQASFGATTDVDLDDLAYVLRNVLAGLGRALDDPDYNYVVQSAPLHEEHPEQFTWHVRIATRLTTSGGFELGTGIPVNPTVPEEAAAAMRQAISASEAKSSSAS